MRVQASYDLAQEKLRREGDAASQNLPLQEAERQSQEHLEAR